MTNITKAAQDALAALDEIHAGKRHPQLALAVAQQLRAALQDKAGEVKCQTCNGHGLVGGYMQDGSGYGEGCPDCNPEPAPLVKWALADQPAPVVPDDHPLMIFARECELGTYMEHEVPMAARKAIAASQQKGLQHG